MLSPCHLCHPCPFAVGQRPFPTGAHRPFAALCDTTLLKVGVFSAISSPTFRGHRPCTAPCGTTLLKVGVFLAISSPTFGGRWPSSRSPVHHSAVFCTGRSCKCLAYRKRSVFCTARPCKGMPYSRRPFSVRREIRVQVRVEQRGNAITRLVKRCPVAFCGAGYRVKAVERLEPELRCGRKVRGIRAAEWSSILRDARRAARANGQPHSMK